MILKSKTRVAPGFSYLTIHTTTDDEPLNIL
jgi:hypothetical protein